MSREESESEFELDSRIDESVCKDDVSDIMASSSSKPGSIHWSPRASTSFFSSSSMICSFCTTERSRINSGDAIDSGDVANSGDVAC